MHTPAAIHIYLVTSDPRLLDSVRVLGSDGEEEVTVERAKAYIRSAYDAYLTLFRNSSTHRVHEFDLSEPPEYS